MMQKFDLTNNRNGQHLIRTAYYAEQVNFKQSMQQMQSTNLVSIINYSFWLYELKAHDIKTLRQSSSADELSSSVTLNTVS